ncbi:MAG: VOC family protein, partial [Caldimonas sp.]
MPSLELDHLVVGAASLEVGRAWCERTFGVTAQAGGKHPAMATHNLLMSIASPYFPKAYLEIIAIDPDATASQRPRWFDLDDAAVRAHIAAAPTLLHWVARVRTGEADDIDVALALLRAAGHDPGDVADSQRATASGGVLRWRITLPRDGRRAGGGAVPLLI